MDSPGLSALKGPELDQARIPEGTDRPACPPATSRRLRIALVSYRSNPYSGGQGIYVKYLSRALAELGHHVQVISGEPYPELDSSVGLIPLPGMNFYDYPTARAAVRDRGLSSLTDALEYLSYISGGFPEPKTFGRRLARYMAGQGQGFDIVHDNQSLCSGLLQVMSRNIPVVSTIHHPITRDLETALANEPQWGMRLLIRRWHSFLRMQKRVAPRLKQILTVSDCSRQDLVRDFGLNPERISVVHNGVDLTSFAPMDDVERRPFRVMATASADVPLKGLSTLLQAVSQLKNEMPRLELTVLGKPKTDGPTERMISELELNDHVRFVNNITTQKLRYLYARASVAVIPSLYEGFGLPAAEAMACGVPVISTTGGALPEVVGRAGILVPPGDAPRMARALKTLLESPEMGLSLGRQGRQRMEASFTWDKAARRTVQVYERLLAEQRTESRGQKSEDRGQKVAAAKTQDAAAGIQK
jgi:glycosyltransferase involved in cell wall biosynthesis